MQLKLHRRCTIMISIFLVILIIAVAYLTMNADAWRDRFLEVMIIIVAVSTVFLVFFKYYENNADKNIINKMVREDRYALAKIKDGKFERIIKDSNNHKYTVWKLDLEVYDQDLNTHEMAIYEKFDASQTKIPRGNVYVTYDEEKPDHMFLVPNILLNISPNASDIVNKYEAKVKDIKYLNVYYQKGIIVETFKKSMNKAREVDS